MIRPEQQCHTWIDVSDRRCPNRWQHAIVLTEVTRVIGRGHSMVGTYAAGTWHFCNTHARIFERDREPS